jgi:hypothetical protein
MKHQTALEWFLMTMNIRGLLPNDDIVECYKQAKEMEKEQITDAYLEGGRKGFNFFGDDFEKYYEETYTQSS